MACWAHLPSLVVQSVWGGVGLEKGVSLSFQVTLLLPPLVWGPHFENNWAAGKLTNELVGAELYLKAELLCG